jgi:hypothetical protein
VRTKKHPVVVTGDTMLVVSVAEDGGRNSLVAVHLYDVGQSSMQMAAERLTSSVFYSFNMMM